MKKRLALIHTVNWYTKSVIEPFAKKWSKEHRDVEIINIMDDSLLSESLKNGGPTAAVIQRFTLYAMAAEAAGADVIMSTCTTMGEAMRCARRMVSVPLFNIDEPMAKEAVRIGDRLGVIATVPTSAPATRRLLEDEATQARRPIQIETVINEEAFSYLLQNNIERHDELVHREIDALSQRVDAIVLGQISLSQIEHKSDVPILQVGNSGFAEAARVLNLTKT
jgi:aspartate/glutamate racemase